MAYLSKFLVLFRFDDFFNFAIFLGLAKVWQTEGMWLWLLVLVTGDR